MRKDRHDLVDHAHVANGGQALGWRGGPPHDAEEIAALEAPPHRLRDPADLAVAGTPRVAVVDEVGDLDARMGPLLELDLEPGAARRRVGNVARDDESRNGAIHQLGEGPFDVFARQAEAGGDASLPAFALEAQGDRLQRARGVRGPAPAEDALAAHHDADDPVLQSPIRSLGHTLIFCAINMLLAPPLWLPCTVSEPATKRGGPLDRNQLKYTAAYTWASSPRLQGIRMNTLKVVAIVLILAGAAALAFGGFSYTKETHKADIAPIHLSVQEKENVNIPLWAGLGAIVAGVGLLVIRK